MRSVSIRREFPHRLLVQLEEHQALARWNNNALVNLQGEVFVADSGQVLPGFIGQDGTSYEVVSHYEQFSRQLAALDMRVAQLALSPRHAWQLRLSNGMVLELGRENMQQRLERFVSVYPYLGGGGQGATDRNTVRYVDLRYRNGFAVKRAAEDKQLRIEG